jgi:hypothetical protein
MNMLRVAIVTGSTRPLFTDFESYKNFTPAPRHESQVHAMLDQLITWGAALKTVRVRASLAAAE